MATSKKKNKKDTQATASSPPVTAPSRMHLALENEPTIAKADAKEFHVCMGLNSCKDRGFSGKNNCAGQGDCATIVHSCHTLNECKGQGGCGLFGTKQEFCHPGENDCKYQGSCGSPILASRFIVDGPNKGLSVWQLARKRFEIRMKNQGKTVGPPPHGLKYGPTTEYVSQRKMYGACGQSGDRYCSYAFDPQTNAKEKAARRKKFEEKSAQNPSPYKGCPE